MGQAREEVAPGQRAGVGVGDVDPGQRAGVGVGDVDLDLRDDDEQRRGGDRPAVVRRHRLPGREVHLVGVDGAVGRHHVSDGEVRQQRAAQHLQHAGDHPARSAGEHGQPPARAPAGRRLGHEAQVVGLLAHLRDQRDAHRGAGAEGQQVEAAAAVAAVLAAVGREVGQQARVIREHVDVGHDQHHQPQRLRPDLQRADGGDAVRDHRDHHQRADQVAPGRRDVEGEFQRVGHHRRLEREEDEGEAGVDERGDGRADVAEAGAAREQVHVDAVARGVDADRPARQQDHQAGGQDGQRRVHEAVLHQQRRAHRLEDQERRRAAERRVGDAPLAQAAERTWREAQRVVLDRLAGDPGVVVAARLDDALRGDGAGIGRAGIDGMHGRAGSRNAPAPLAPTEPDVTMHLASLVLVGRAWNSPPARRTSS